MFLTLLASSPVPFGPSMDELPELEGGLQEIEESKAIGRQSGYWAKIRGRLVKSSTSQDPEEAKKEWARDGNPWAAQGGKCELCDHTPITFHFPIKNRLNGHRLVVGSECIYNYLEIEGFEDRERLSKRLNAEIGALKRKEKGEISEEEVAMVSDLTRLEGELVSRVKQFTGGQDLDTKEYRDSLEPVDFAREIDIKGQAVMTATTVREALQHLIWFQDKTRKRSKTYQGFGILSLIQSILRWRDIKEKVTALTALKKSLDDVFKHGDPGQVVSRVWDAIKDGLSGVVKKHREECDEANKTLVHNYDVDMLNLQKYPRMKGILEEGIRETTALNESTFKKLSDFLMGKEVFEMPLNSMWRTWRSLDCDFSTFPGKGLSVSSFVRSMLKFKVDHSTWSSLLHSYSVQGTPPMDTTGFIAAAMQIAEEGLVSDDLNFAERTIPSAMIWAPRDKKEKVADIVRNHIDCLGNVAKAEKVPLHKVMSEFFGFDVKEALERFTKDKDFERGFCETIVQRAWPNRYKMSPKQMDVVKRQLGWKPAPVPNSMWDEFKSELTKEVELGATYQR